MDCGEPLLRTAQIPLAEFLLKLGRHINLSRGPGLRRREHEQIAFLRLDVLPELPGLFSYNLSMTKVLLIAKPLPVLPVTVLVLDFPSAATTILFVTVA